MLLLRAFGQHGGQGKGCEDDREGDGDDYGEECFH